MKMSIIVAGSIILAAGFPVPSFASSLGAGGGENMTRVWVTVSARKGESLWRTCRRIYQYDAYGVKRSKRPGKVRCWIEASRVSDPAGR